jgi:beta-aspartyl-dipeptidase (metallo-type)
MDLTAGTAPEQETDSDVSVETALRLLLEKGGTLERVTVSSDGNGSLPVFDAAGRLVGLTVASPRSLLETFRSLVGRGILSLEQAAGLFALHPAEIYKLNRKGSIKPGQDADLIFFDRDFQLTDVIAGGRVLMADSRLLVKSTFS